MAVEYSLANLPLKDDLLINATFVEFSANLAQVEYFVQRYIYKHVAMQITYRYSTLLPYQSPQELDLLLEEFLEYQLLSSS